MYRILRNLINCCHSSAYIAGIAIKEKGSGRSLKADLAKEVTDVPVTTICAVGECCSSDTAHSEAKLLRGRFEDIDDLGRYMFPGVEDPA